MAGDRHGAFLHGFEQRALGLGRGAVDLVGEEQVGEHRPLLVLEFQLAAARVLEQFGADDVRGHQVRGELDALEADAEHFGERFDEERLRQPRHTDEQAMAPREKADEQQSDDFVLADDDPAQFAGDPVGDFLAQASGREFVHGTH